MEQNEKIVTRKFIKRGMPSWEICALPMQEYRFGWQLVQFDCSILDQGNTNDERPVVLVTMGWQRLDWPRPVIPRSFPKEVIWVNPYNKMPLWTWLRLWFYRMWSTRYREPTDVSPNECV